MKSVETILERANAEVSAGRMWRAKEILRGAIGSGRVEPALLERYGQLLESLGERMEAGKYLFLSGLRAPQHAESMSLFLERHSRRGGKDLAAQFPAAVRRSRFADLPHAVQSDLRELGVAPEMFGRAPNESPRTSWGARVTMAGALVVLVIFFLAALLGIGVMGAWLWNMLFN